MSLQDSPLTAASFLVVLILISQLSDEQKMQLILHSVQATMLRGVYLVYRLAHDYPSATYATILHCVGHRMAG